MERETKNTDFHLALHTEKKKNEIIKFDFGKLLIAFTYYTLALNPPNEEDNDATRGCRRSAIHPRPLFSLVIDFRGLCMSATGFIIFAAECREGEGGVFKLRASRSSCGSISGLACCLNLHWTNMQPARADFGST